MASDPLSPALQAEASEELPPPEFTLVDKVMIGLAFVSAVIIIADIWFRPYLVYENYGRLAGDAALRDPLFGDSPWFRPFWLVLALDFVITLIFAAEFFASAKEFDGTLGEYARANWFDVVGMLPMAFFVGIDLFVFGCSQPGDPTRTLVLLVGCAAPSGLGLLRFLRFARIIRIVVAGSRLTRAAGMTFGEQVIRRVFQRYQAFVVATLTTPILIQSIRITQAIVKQGKYAQSVGEELDRKRDEIYALIMKNLEARRSTAALVGPPFIRDAIRRVENEVLDTVVLTLTSEELNAIIRDSVDKVLEDFKGELRRKEWAQDAFVTPSEGTGRRGSVLDGRA